jgi:hypothetical protein
VRDGRLEDLTDPVELVDLEELIRGVYLLSSSVHSFDNSSRFRKLASSRSSRRASNFAGEELYESLRARGRRPG